jgi:LuxR family maltose regulon positive regulatory protein
MVGVSRFIENFSGRHQFILGYLTDEVLARQPEQIREFLLLTSILKRMCGSLCDVLVKQLMDTEGPFTSSREILDYLHRANLFVVSLDDEGEWYRYHRLFAELLQSRLRVTVPDQIPELYLSASAWCEQNSFLAEAVNYALAITAYGTAAEIIERAIPKVSSWSSVNVAIFLEWLKVLPEDVVCVRPRLRLFSSRVFYLIGQREETERILEELEVSLSGNTAIPEADEILGSAMADRASYAAVRGDVQQAVELVNRAQMYLPDHAGMHMRVSAILGLAYFRGGKVIEAAREFSRAIAAIQSLKLGVIAAPVFCNLAEVQIVQGHLRQAYRTCQDSLEMASIDGTPVSVAGFPGLEIGKILYEQNILQDAERYVSESLDLLERSGTTDSFGIGHALLARIKQALGDEEEAMVAIQHAIQIARDFDIARVLNLIEAYQARIWLAQKKYDLAVSWANEYSKIGETEYLREFEDLTLARTLLLQRKPSKALELLDSMRQSAEPAGRMGTVIEIFVLLALAFWNLDVKDEALVSLEKALQLAEPEGYVRIFVNEGATIARLLSQASDRGITPHYTRQLIESINAEIGVKPLSQKSPLVEPLSPRELEVLELLASGLTNLEITQKLFISLPTVKSHARNIYGKLGVHNRTSAVKRAQELGILSS